MNDSSQIFGTSQYLTFVYHIMKQLDNIVALLIESSNLLLPTCVELNCTANIIIAHMKQGWYLIMKSSAMEPHNNPSPTYSIHQ